MIITIDYIKDAGIIDKERIVFSVKEDGQLGKYLIAESNTIDDSRFSAKIKNPFWFPDKDVKAGDLVILYTKEGSTNTVSNEDGSHLYFFYWGLKESHLSIDNACVVLFESSWKVSSVPKLDE